MYSKKLKEIREKENKLQKDIANLLGISATTYSTYESEYDILPIKHLNTLCNYFNVSFDYILELTNIQNYFNAAKEINLKLSSKRLKEFRKENKITQVKFATILNTPQSMISYYESSKNIMPLIHIYSICKKYNISADYLLGKIDTPKYLNSTKK